MCVVDCPWLEEWLLRQHKVYWYPISPPKVVQKKTQDHPRFSSGFFIKVCTIRIAVTLILSRLTDDSSCTQQNNEAFLHSVQGYLIVHRSDDMRTSECTS